MKGGYGDKMMQEVLIEPYKKARVDNIEITNPKLQSNRKNRAQQGSGGHPNIKRKQLDFS